MQRLWMTKSNNFALQFGGPQRIGTLSGTFCGELWNSLTFITLLALFRSYHSCLLQVLVMSICRCSFNVLLALWLWNIKYVLSDKTSLVFFYLPFFMYDNYWLTISYETFKYSTSAFGFLLLFLNSRNSIYISQVFTSIFGQTFFGRRILLFLFHRRKKKTSPRGAFIPYEICPRASRKR